MCLRARWLEPGSPLADPPEGLDVAVLGTIVKQDVGNLQPSDSLL